MSDLGPVLSVRALTKCYPGFRLSEVSFEIPRGFVMGLVGPNGAGKTTTLKAVLGLLRRDGGEIRVAGFDPALSGARARGCIGFVHDEPRFPSYLSLGRIGRLVRSFYPAWEEERFLRLAGEFGLDLRRRFGTRSRGTKMKFSLALALSHGARLIVMDEPTAGLDPVFRRGLLDLLQQELEDSGTSILFSTHITSDLDRIADYVTLLQEGRVVFSESKEEILDRWWLVKGGLELLGEAPGDWTRGIERGPHGFEAVTDRVDLVRRLFGERVVLERPRLEEIIFLTSRGTGHD